jgi:hypothetical protein
MAFADCGIEVVDQEPGIEPFSAAILAIHRHQRAPKRSTEMVSDCGKAHLGAANSDGWKSVEEVRGFVHAGHRLRVNTTRCRRFRV